VSQEGLPEAPLAPRPFVELWGCGIRRAAVVYMDCGGGSYMRDEGVREEAAEGDWRRGGRWGGDGGEKGGWRKRSVGG
jgi:hypothetical protein